MDASGSAAAWSATGSTSTWATSARRSWRQNKTWQAIQALSEDDRRRRADAAGDGRARRRRAGQHPVELRAALGRRPADHDRQPGRPGPRRAATAGCWTTTSSTGSRPRCAARSTRACEHLILGTSLPWLLPHAIHNIERWNETLNVRHEGRWRGRLAENLRQAADLEHWAAFGDSFERLGRALVSVARGEHGPGAGDGAGAVRRRPPRLRRRARAARRPRRARAPADGVPAAQPGAAPDPGRLPDRLEPVGEAVHRDPGAACPGEAERARSGRSRPGPFFGNQIGELVLNGREARFQLSVTELGQEELRQVLDMPLAGA